MRTLAVAFLATTLLAGSLAAQRRTPSPVGGFGNVVFPGTGSPPARSNITGFGNILTPGTPRRILPPFSITDPTFAHGIGQVVAGRAPHPGVFGRFNRGNSNVIYVPYGYPIYGGDFYGGGQPQVVVVYPQQQAPVAINQQFAGPAQPVFEEAPPAEASVPDISVYQAPTRTAEEMAAAAPTAPYYLIAFKDHSIYSAVAYWIDGDTLHYFTSGNNHNQVSLDLVDRELTERLNSERNITIRLPRK